MWEPRRATVDQPRDVSPVGASTPSVPSGSQNDPPTPVLAPPATPSAPVDASVEKALRARVEAYWGARSRSNLLAAYPFYAPSFRAKYSSEAFLETFQRLLRFRPRFRGIERIHFQSDGPTATVSVKLSSRPEALMGEELVTVTNETWRLIDRVWWKEGEPLLPEF
jgi:hypothetical protein